MELVGWWRGVGSTSGVVHGGKKLTRAHTAYSTETRWAPSPRLFRPHFTDSTPSLFLLSPPRTHFFVAPPPHCCSNTTCFLRHPPSLTCTAPPGTASQPSDCFPSFPSLDTPQPNPTPQPNLLIILLRIRVALYLPPHLLSSPAAPRLYIDPP